MANDLSSRQWRLDTPTPFGSAGAVLWTGNIKLGNINWDTYTAQGQSCIIKDQNGKLVWQFTGAADLSAQKSNKIGWVNGLVLDTLDAGVVTIAVE